MFHYEVKSSLLDMWRKSPSRLLFQKSLPTLSVVSVQRRPDQRMYSQRPLWLNAILDNHTLPAKLFAWSPSNLGLQDIHPRSADPNDDLGNRIFVLGAGNLGRLFASCLVQSSSCPPVTLVVHKKELLTQWVDSKGIEIERSGVVEKHKNLDIEWWTDVPPKHGHVREVANGKKLRNLIVTTKAGAALPQVDRLRGYLDNRSTIAFAQNGMSKLWPPHGPAYTAHRFASGRTPTFLACVTTHGVTSLGPFRSRHASLADVAIGPVLSNQPGNVDVTYLEAQIVKAPVLNGRSVSRPELWVFQLEKLVVNSIINPLTAILRCQNGALFTQPDGVIGKILDQLLLEASTVLQALILHESSLDILVGPKGPPSRTTATQSSPSGISSQRALSIRFSQPHLRDMLYHVGHKVRENTSSMLQDVRAGKQTEVRDFNGWFVDMAAFLDSSLDVRGHRTLVSLIEQGRVMRADELGQYFKISDTIS